LLAPRFSVGKTLFVHEIALGLCRDVHANPAIVCYRRKREMRKNKTDNTILIRIEVPRGKYTETCFPL